MDGTELGKAFTVYLGDDTSSATGEALIPDSSSGAVSFKDDGKAVLDGTIEKEKKKDDSGEPNVPGAIEDVSTDMTYSIVFKSDAGNAYQGAKIALKYEVKAIQFRNNPSPDWSKAVILVKN